MNVILRVVRYVIIDHQRYVRHVYTSCDYVGCHQDSYLTVPEVQHHLVSLRLLQIAMHCARVNM